MSKPANRLANFRSYSYYHVLAMCDSSATADELSKAQSEDAWLHATAETAVPDTRPNSKGLGPYSPKQIDGAGKYVILINGSTDAAYVIDNAKWTSATAASAVPGDRSTSIAVEGSIAISEPKGIAFLDQVVQCSVALGVDSAQVVYVLKTFFVGHAYDSKYGEYQDFITDVPPVTFIAYDVTGAFTEAGGTYTIQFVGAGHGASRLPQYGKAVNAMSITAGDSLETTLRKLQDNINDSYSRYFSCVYDQLASMEGADTEPLLKSLRKVNYVIEVGSDYKDANGQIKYTVTNQPQQFKNSAGCSDNAQITFPTSCSIETAISTIMMMSPQVLSDMGKGDASDSVKYEYKIHTALVSKPVGDSDDGALDYTVYYRVERFMTPKTISYDPDFRVLQQDDAQLRQNPRYEQIRRNIIEFDYMYTGANIDILEFDMKVNMGLAYLQTATLANTFKSQLERSSNRMMQASTQDVNSFSVRSNGALVQTPVFFGSQIKVPAMMNQQDAAMAIQSAYTLNKHASIEMAEASMKIIGNDRLLGTTNQTTSPEYVVNSAGKRFTTETVDQQKPEDASLANFADWSFIPAFVKVNVKMPRENDDFALFTGQSKSGDPRTDPGMTDYARDFWFDGYYYVYGIEHVFDGGEFTQNLQMISLPKESSFNTTKAPTKEVNISNDVGKCFDNQIGCGVSQGASTPTTTTPNSAVPQTPASGSTAATNKADADTQNNAAKGPANVKGWDKASPAVKTAIIDAANRYGVDQTVLAQFAAKESSFNPTAQAKTSSATGLFQFLKDTWNGLVKQGQIDGVNTSNGLVTTPGKVPQAGDPRFDPKLNAYAGAVFLRDNGRAIGSNDVGDLYLAHFLGAGTAKKVISDCQTSGGNNKLTTVLGTKLAGEIAAANPSIANANTTCAELRAWAAKSMASTLINPSRVAGPVKPPTAPSATITPSSRADANRRTADKPVAAVQNCGTQSAKTDNPCGPTARKA